MTNKQIRYILTTPIRAIGFISVLLVFTSLFLCRMIVQWEKPSDTLSALEGKLGQINEIIKKDK